jgi:diguanylate cyclase (GGDEF)-like protein
MQENNILIIDDEPIIVDAISASLEGEGYEILSAENGKEGLELYYEKKPVVIILDLRMPVMDGIKFLENLRPSPDSASSVIVLTGHGDEEDMKNCFRLGVSAFLRKPFNLYELKGIVRNSVELKRTQRHLREEIAGRIKIEEELRMHRDHLETLVEKRTEELAIANEELRKEIEERRLIEEKLQGLATTDSLTGAYNRIKFTELIAREIERFKRYGIPLSLMMFDLDHFKNVNDAFGHAVGDQILKKVTDIVAENKRILDYLVRWGGEEFMMIATETSLEPTVTLAERIRKVLEDHRFATVDGVTVSLGVTQFKEGDTVDTVITRVDDALYKAKKNGRNRVEVIV